MQMSFEEATIDKEATKNAVDRELEKYRMYLLMDPEDNEPKITSQFKLVASAPSNLFHSTTEDAAIKRVDLEKKRRDFIQKMQRAVNRLAYQEREVMIKRYLTDNEVYDYEVYNDMGISERKYYRIKSRAFYKLALILRIEVYREKSGEAS